MPTWVYIWMIKIKQYMGLGDCWGQRDPTRDFVYHKSGQIMDRQKGIMWSGTVHVPICFTAWS